MLSALISVTTPASANFRVSPRPILILQRCARLSLTLPQFSNSHDIATYLQCSLTVPNRILRVVERAYLSVFLLSSSWLLTTKLFHPSQSRSSGINLYSPQ
jgi:hypothetical protein